jgi:predicted TIM-barrel fold metal-dependent hydrolase
MSIKPISADSHVTEPPGCYIDHIDPKFRDVAPRVERDNKRGDIYVIDGMDTPIPMGLVAAAGVDPKDMRPGGVRFEDLHKGGWDGTARTADQDRDGIAAELIYPTVGMLLCSHPDLDYKKSCFDAYNRWLVGFCEAAPERLFGIGQTAIRSVDEAIEDLRGFKEAGFKGVMMPGAPGASDYDDPIYDPLWEAAVALDMPISFHILTTKGSDFMQPRGPRINAWQSVVRGCQDIIGMFIYSGVFERHPDLKLVCVEGDAGWAPHYMYRLDHTYKRHRYWMKCQELGRLPSEYFRSNVYMTFQDDWVAFKVKDLLNVRRLMWANDFPHSDSTWPWSQELLAEHTIDLTESEKQLILRDNVRELFNLPVQ